MGSRRGEVPMSAVAGTGVESPPGDGRKGSGRGASAVTLEGDGLCPSAGSAGL